MSRNSDGRLMRKGWAPFEGPAPPARPPQRIPYRPSCLVVGAIALVVACVSCCVFGVIAQSYMRESINPLDINIRYENDTERPLVVAICWWKECDELLDPFTVAAGEIYDDRGFRPWWLVVAEVDGRVLGCVDADGVAEPVKLSNIVDCPAEFAIPEWLPMESATPVPQGSPARSGKEPWNGR